MSVTTILASSSVAHLIKPLDIKNALPNLKYKSVLKYIFFKKSPNLVSDLKYHTTSLLPSHKLGLGAVASLEFFG